MRRKLKNGLLAAAFAGVVGASLLLAQDQPPGPDAAGDQQHGVARLAIADGGVNIGRADSGGLVAAAINAPLMTGDHLQTSPTGYAAVEFDAVNTVRLAPNTDLGFADLEYGRYRLQLGAGTIQYRVLGPENAQVEIDTPAVGLTPLGPGQYRVAVLPDGTIRVTVRSGALQLDGPRGSEQISAGRSVLVQGDPADPQISDIAEIPQDPFDQWCDGLDARLQGGPSEQYVGPDVGGAQDLNAYGNWVPSQYGQVWEPQVPYAGWSPYSDGQWVWEGYYGWTWVDAAPWGWAPYHYGRWFWNGPHGWCWWPGLRRPHVYWSPAMVGFFGWGGSAGIGWVALAPYEVFHPWWGRHRDFAFYSHGWSRYGEVRDVDVMRVYRNAGVRGGALVAERDRFGRVSGERFRAAAVTQMRQTSLFRGSLPMRPSHASFHFSNRAAVANPRLAAAESRQFYARGNFRPAPRASYAPQRAYRAPQNMQNNRPRERSNGGWQRFGLPGAGNPPMERSFQGTRPQDRRISPQNRGGWHQFGAPEHPRNYWFQAPQRSVRAPSNRGQSYRYARPQAPRDRAPSFHSQPSRGGGYRGGGSGQRSGGGGHRR